MGITDADIVRDSTAVRPGETFEDYHARTGKSRASYFRGKPDKKARRSHQTTEIETCVRPTQPGPDTSARVVETLERLVEAQYRQLDAQQRQIDAKDEQLAAQARTIDRLFSLQEQKALPASAARGWFARITGKAG